MSILAKFHKQPQAIKSAIILYAIVWGFVTIVFLTGFIDGLDPKIYKSIQLITLPWSMATTKTGIKIEELFGSIFYPISALLRIGIEILIPAALDFFIIFAFFKFTRFLKKTKPSSPA